MNLLLTLTVANPGIEPGTLRLEQRKKRSNHRLLRCSSMRVPGSMPGFAYVKVSIKFMKHCPAI